MEVVGELNFDRALQLFLVASVLYLIYRQNKTDSTVQKTEVKVQRIEEGVQKTQTEVQETRQEFQEFKEEVPHKVSTQMLAKIRSATFAILDTEGHPVCCGFFVSSCGVALTAAHEAEKWLINKKNKIVARAATFSKTKLELEVVEPSIGDLDIAVLRIPTPATAPRPCLPVPENTFTEDELSGAAVNLIHGSIAWFSGMEKNLPKCSQRAGSIIHTTDTTVHYDVGTYKGDSGAALLLSGKRVIGLHSAGFNDLDQAQSETSPSTAADAVRLDLPEVRAAVMKYMKKKSS